MGFVRIADVVLVVSDSEVLIMFFVLDHEILQEIFRQRIK